MNFRDFYKNGCQAKLFLRRCHAKQGKMPKYGFVKKDGGFETKDKKNPGALHVGTIELPKKLKDSLKLYYEQYPRKQIVDDGLKLMSHIANRGRPTHATWEKYKQQAGAQPRRTGKKGRDRDSVSKFHLDEAMQMGLLTEEHLDEEIQRELKKTEDIISDIKDNQNETCDTHDIENDLDDQFEYEENIKKKKIMKRPEMKAYSMIRYGSRETAAFTASLLPSVYGSTLKVLQEIRKREPNYHPKTLLDFGSGTGMTVWAAYSIWGDSISEYQCVDASGHMNKAAEFLLRGSSDINVPTKIPYVYFKQFLPLSNQIKYDVVVAAYTLTEMPFQKQRLQAIQSLWRKTKDFLVIIEPGNNEGFETALQARRFVAGKDKEKESEFDYSQYEDFFSGSDLEAGDEESGHIFAPCTHEHVCARTDVNTRDHPCNFSQKVELSYAFQTIRKLKKFGYFNERFSYIVLRKSSEDSEPKDGVEWARILDPIKLKRRHVICELCCHNGNIEKHVITKGKDPDVYKAARHFLKWGDMLPLDKAKRPMDIRPSPSCKNKE